MGRDIIQAWHFRGVELQTSIWLREGMRKISGDEWKSYIVELNLWKFQHFNNTTKQRSERLHVKYRVVASEFQEQGNSGEKIHITKIFTKKKNSVTIIL